MEHQALTLWGNDSLIILIIKDEISTYKTITELQQQLHKRPRHRSNLIIGILWLLKIWEKESQEDFFEYYERLLRNACSNDVMDDQELEKQAQSIYKKLRARAQKSIIARRQRYAISPSPQKTQKTKKQSNKKTQG